jgi:amino acid adenylation domain-containing protein
VPLDESLAARLVAFARNERATPVMVVLAAWTALLARYSRQDEVTVGFDLGDGHVPRAVQATLADRPIFTGLLREVRDAVLDAMAGTGAGVSFDDRGELYRVTFREAVDGGPLPSDLDLSVAAADGACAATLRYDTGCWDRDTVLGLAVALAELLDDVLDRPHRPVHDLRVLPAAARAGAWSAGRGPAAAVPRAETIHGLIEAQVDRTPDAPAIRHGGDILTYRELNARANRLAHHLRALGVGPEVVVGLAMPRTAAAITALLGILKAGAAYLPIDPTYPSERISYTLADADVGALVTDTATERGLPPYRAPLLVVDAADAREMLATAPAGNLTSGAIAANLAYLIYTSGSTGRPKGVEVAHRGATNLAGVVGAAFDIGAGDRVAQFASLSFDASVWETVMALTSGACLHVVTTTGAGSADIVRQLRDERVTVGTFPPSFLAAVDPADLPDLRLVISAGESCGASLAETWSRGRRFVNAYGPTETTVCATFGDHTGGSAPTIGVPFAGVEAHALDAGLAPLPPGVPGELYLAGINLARGYHNRPAATAEAFLPSPYGPPGSRLYRSRDVARRRPDGALLHLGRTDDQIKLRGYRIELGEVEAALAGHAQVARAAVLVRELPDVGPQLVAYLSLRAQMTAVPAPAPADLRRFLAGSLPDYMVPGRFVILDALPSTPNGKVDRKALPDPTTRPGQPTDRGGSPASETEQRIAAIWATALGIVTVTRDDNFLEIGGHSLVAAQIIARVREAFELSRLPVRVLFERPVLSDFAGAVDSMLAQTLVASVS